ncbi:hypothetical protein MAPG_08217 [Magnaporthiopsis poae ATCC 64411]|uniref:Uncharacterized protein n=1 Tax=Magnaporthiopsis poae (strain ATCC 64411 / 73-15) TaxID=644358 RepID=A0A0C4E6S1_MAGP6|nr:hypothetical protein MAPG_08217 [Magnaporthiopsis poae ATCC 64411]
MHNWTGGAVTGEDSAPLVARREGGGEHSRKLEGEKKGGAIADACAGSMAVLGVGWWVRSAVPPRLTNLWLPGICSGRDAGGKKRGEAQAGSMLVEELGRHREKRRR